MKPRVLFVGNFLSRHGLNRQVCEDLSERLEARGWRISRASHHRNQAARLADILTTCATARADVAHVDVFSGNAFLWALAAATTLRARRIPYLLTLHGGSLPKFARRHPRRFRLLLRHAYSVTSPSKYLSQQLGLQHTALAIRNGIELESYPYRPRARLAPRLVWLRGYRHIYNPEDAVRVLANISARHPSATLRMFGGDSGDGSLERTRKVARQLGVEGRVDIELAVPKRRVGEVLSAADIFLNTTSVDNAPVSVVEALACGLVVVSTNVGGIPTLLEDRGDALLCPAGEPAQLAEAALEALDDPALSARLSRSGRRKAERHAWSAVLPEWESLLQRAADSQPR